MIDFADDPLVVYVTEDVGMLELRINKCLWQAKRWMDKRSTEYDPGEDQGFTSHEHKMLQIFEDYDRRKRSRVEEKH